MLTGRAVCEQLEVGKVEARSHTAAHQGKAAAAPGSLPVIRWHDMKRIPTAESHLDQTVSIRTALKQFQGISINMRPGFIGVEDPVPAAQRLFGQKKQDCCEAIAFGSITALNAIPAAMQFAIPASFRMGLEPMLFDQLFDRLHFNRALSRMFWSLCQIWAIHRNSQLMPSSQNG